MKNILVEVDTDIVAYYDRNFILKDTYIEAYKPISGALDFYIADLNSTTAYTAQVDEIDDFVGGKYLYVDGALLLNPDWIPVGG